MILALYKSAAFLGLFAIALVVVTPVVCEIDSCCAEDDCCTPECTAMCCAVAVCAESFDGLGVLDAAPHDSFILTSSLPQGVSSLPERPPIAAC